MRKPSAAQRHSVWRLIRVPVVAIVVYLVLRLILAGLSARHRFGSPDGVGVDFLAVSAAVVALRVLLLVGLPAYFAYRLVSYLVARALDTRDAPPPPVEAGPT
ncbi:hypothetical protein JK358_21705 [Nocardia sp. 2]|uniref:DUF1206 domain-containing protein n=1 Tax=Nocardia acididurans TaxID=2802282 RepID=A0ABS1M8N7_9NOCA|nr:hypothetical protein [Nocardia acididurans]MBL1077017.1 hypothetical protein [Nocardia acididurans]